MPRWRRAKSCGTPAPGRSGRAGRTRRAQTCAALLFVVMLGVITACSAGPSTRPVIAVRGENGNVASSAPPPSGRQPVPPLENYRNTGLAWSSCTDATKLRMGDTAPAGDQKYECARLPVILDSPSRPGRGNLGLALLRVGTGGTPLVVVNDPDGEPGTLRAARLAASLPAEFLSTFTLIGLDRRGTGKSDGVQCVPDAARTAILESDPGGAKQDDLLEAVGAASQECVLDLENRLTALDSWRTAADLERLRDTLGVSRLNAIGIGDGSRVLTVYASRYPDRIGRMVFDGVPDPTLDAIAAAESRAAAAEQAFDAFASDCAIQNCPLGKDPKQELTVLITRLRTTPVRGPDLNLTPGTALRAVLLGLSDRQRWPALTSALVKAKAGDASGLTSLIAPLVTQRGDNPPLLDGGLVTTCNDQMMRIPPERVAGLAEDWKGKHPFFGAMFARNLLLCGPWPVPQQTKVGPVKSAPPVLVLSTAADPVTPQPGTERAAQQLPAGVVVGWQGAGHGALPQSSCATAAAQKFLIQGETPSGGTVCPP
ncbi:MAG TPA: alpha/beta fold hydrolase [Pseudonocardiaceae bacterium]|nr:alpha/beta fold hydrolase [Pseudonocardiaceae bacterium]